MTAKQKKWIGKYSLRGALGFVFVALFTIAVAVPPSFASDVPAEQGDKETTVDSENTELPREWRWKKPNIKFDHMYRNDR